MAAIIAGLIALLLAGVVSVYVVFLHVEWTLDAYAGAICCLIGRHEFTQASIDWHRKTWG